VDDVARLERDCAEAWPAVVDQPLGQWRLRAAGGFTGRANSALTIGDPGVPLADALARVEAFADHNDIPATAHVIKGTPVEAELTSAGWTVDLDHPGGAGRCALQVTTRNTGAISLYAGLGCVPHHRYRYWIPAR
jgi:hypothetical protein